jgi:hypothetical protein
VLEREIEKRLNQRVKQAGGLSFKWISTVTGVPDRIVILNSCVYFVELKTETGRLSSRQVLVFDELGEHGFPVHVLRNYDDIEDFVNETTKS